MKRIGNPNKGSGDIQQLCKDGIWLRKMSHANKEKWKTTNEGRNLIKELPNQEKSECSGEKETYKYLGILEAEMKVKIKYRIPQENEKTTRNQTT